MGLPSKETDSTSHSEKSLFTSAPIFHFSHIGTHLKCRLSLFVYPFLAARSQFFSDGFVNNHLLASVPEVHCLHISRNDEWFPKPHPPPCKTHAHL